MRKLSNEQKIATQGGAPVTMEEYCDTLYMIIEGGAEWNDGTTYGVSLCQSHGHYA